MMILSQAILILIGTIILMFCDRSEGYTINNNSKNSETITKKIGCHHNETVYADGSLVPTLEPCLSCKCTNKTLICSLKICPEIPIPPPRGCILIQKKNSCCPYLSCSKFNYLLSNGLNRRIINYLDHIERETLDRMVNENVLRRRSDDFDLDGSDEICIHNGTVYKSGSAMSSSSLCSYCYCIGGTQKCVKPKCLLSMEGCKPIFVDSACCPVRYDCTSSKSSSIIQKSQNHARKAGNKHYQRMVQRLQRSRGCIINTVFYSEGQKIPSPLDKPCDICFCIRGSRKCAPKKCAPAIRNCLPVVPKGQCCPSSYDCGYIKDLDRAFKSRQFDLFSLLFGSEEDNVTGEIQSNSSSIIQNENQDQNYQVESTSEKSIFDAIREGLEFIDNNHKLADDFIEIPLLKNNSSLTVPNVNEKIDSEMKKGNNNLTDVYISSSSSEFSDENMNLFDLFIDSSSVRNSKDNQSSIIIEKENDNGSAEEVEDDPNDNYLVVKTSNSTQENENESLTTDHTWSLETDQNKNYDYLTTTTEPTEIDFDTSTIEYEDSSTTTISFTTDISDISAEETTTLMDFTNNFHAINTVTEPNKNVEIIEVEQLAVGTTEKSNIAENLTEKLNIKNITKLQEITMNPIDNLTEITLTDQIAMTNYTTTNNNVTTEKKPETDFLSVLFDGLSTILQENKNVTVNHDRHKNVSTKVEKIVSSTTQIPDDIPNMSYPTPVDKLNMKVYNKPISTIQQFNSIPIHTQTGTENLKLPETIIKPLPMVIKTNPSILETDYDFDYNVPTLPPSLPNLKIIPFLPTDAVKNDFKKDFNYYTPITEKRTNSWMLPPIVATSNHHHHHQFEQSARYPAITEHNPVYVNVPINRKGYGYDDYDYSDFELPNDRISNEYDPAIENSRIGVSDIKFVNTYPKPVKKFDTEIIEFNSDRPPYKIGINEKVTPASNYNFEVMPVNSGFSPPAKTEGGFVPKEPIIDELFYENLYTTNKFHIDLTTTVPNPKMNVTESLMGAGILDPFKDVIKTEHPPNLHSLIEDKEKLLANELVLNDNDKEIISITTDYLPYDNNNNNKTVGCNDANNSDQFNCTEENAFINDTSSLVDNFNNLQKSSNTSEIGSKLTDKTKISFLKIPEDPVTNKSPESTIKNKSSIEANFNKTLDSLFELFADKNIKNHNIGKISTTLSNVSEKTIFGKINTKTQSQKNSPQSANDESLTDLNNLNDDLLPSSSSSYTSIFPLSSSSSTTMTTIKESNIFLSEPFNKLPFMKPSYPIKQSNLETPINNYDLIFPGFKTNSYDVGTYPLMHHTLLKDSIVSNTESYVVNPVDVNKLKKEHTIVKAEIFTKPENLNTIKDPAGILKLAGCNIYGRMYRVGRIISELSGPCLECKCTEVGVNCSPLIC